MRKYLFFVIFLSANYQSGYAQTSFQTRTATFLNNLNNFREVFGDQGYPMATAGDVTADDGIYASTSKLTAGKDSAGPFRTSSFSSLALQGFGFTIPDDAIIENIYIRLRRFKTGSAPVGDYFLSLMQRYQCGSGPCTYGVFWTKNDSYPGKIYPSTETEYVFSQSGGGNDGGFNHDEAYQWTPAIVNHQFFGLRIDSYPPIGKGTVVINYDMVEVTVEYSQPANIAKKSPDAIVESKSLKEPIVFPNPFTTKTTIQFTAIESGNAVAGLYNITGLKIRTLFSGNVVQGLTYNVAVGDAQLPKGIYVYMISNGKQKHTGRIIKLE